jgi:hypothetical protein
MTDDIDNRQSKRPRFDESAREGVKRVYHMWKLSHARSGTSPDSGPLLASQLAHLPLAHPAEKYALARCLDGIIKRVRDSNPHC